MGKAHEPSHARARTRGDREAEFQFTSYRNEKGDGKQIIAIEDRNAVAGLAHPQKRLARETATAADFQTVGERGRGLKPQTSHTLKSRFGPACSRFCRIAWMFATLEGREFLAASPITAASPR